MGRADHQHYGVGQYSLHGNLQKKIYKNFGIISITFLGVFTAFQAVSSLQSSGVTDDDNFSVVINNIPLLVIYASLVVSSAFLTNIVIDRLGTRWTLIVCQIPYALYICTFYYPHIAITVPAGVLLGLSGAPLWTAKCRYLCHLAERYSLLCKTNLSHAYSAFFGCYFMVFLSTGVWGNLIYYVVYVIYTDGGHVTEGAGGHGTGSLDCGVNYDYTELEIGDYDEINNTNIKFNLISTYLSIALVSILLLAIYGDGIEGDEDTCTTSLLTSLLKTVKSLLADRKQLLLIPLTVWSGVEQAFFISVFAESYVVCYYGILTHGIMMITYGLTGSLSAVVFGLLRSIMPLKIILLVAGLLNCTVLALSLTLGKMLLVTHLCVAMWGVAEGIWQPQIGVLYAELFPEDQVAAFSNYRVWESLGYILVFSLKLGKVNVATIIYIVIILLGLGMLGYVALMIDLRREKNTQIAPRIVKGPNVKYTDN